jgi:hypothetical protein
MADISFVFFSGVFFDFFFFCFFCLFSALGAPWVGPQGRRARNGSLSGYRRRQRNQEKYSNYPEKKFIIPSTSFLIGLERMLTVVRQKASSSG